MEGATDFGPMQMLVIAFEDAKFTGEILPELQRLREHDIVRLVDLLVVSKDDEGNLTHLRTSDLSDEELRGLGAAVGALIGLGAEGEEGLAEGADAGADELAGGVIGDEQDRAITDAVPNGSAAAIALLEHRWAMPLRDAVQRAGGMTVSDTWLRPADMVGIGARLAAESGP
ncbi:MAG TPA: DUF6325 family protein [Streptosporangiaceae bacterium]|jgi:uncharacterized membrane protein